MVFDVRKYDFLFFLFHYFIFFETVYLNNKLMSNIEDCIKTEINS